MNSLELPASKLEAARNLLFWLCNELQQSLSSVSSCTELSDFPPWVTHTFRVRHKSHGACAGMISPCCSIHEAKGGRRRVPKRARQPSQTLRADVVHLCVRTYNQYRIQQQCFSRDDVLDPDKLCSCNQYYLKVDTTKCPGWLYLENIPF